MDRLLFYWLSRYLVYDDGICRFSTLLSLQHCSLSPAIYHHCRSRIWTASARQILDVQIRLRQLTIDYLVLVVTTNVSTALFGPPSACRQGYRKGCTKLSSWLQKRLCTGLPRVTVGLWLFFTYSLCRLHHQILMFWVIPGHTFSILIQSGVVIN